MSEPCPACGARLPAFEAGTVGPSHCPRCGLRLTLGGKRRDPRRGTDADTRPPFRAWRAVGYALPFWGRNLPALAVIAFLLDLPSWSHPLQASGPETWLPSPNGIVELSRGYLFQLAPQAFVAALVVGVLRSRDTGKMDLARSLSEGARRFVPVLGITLVVFAWWELLVLPYRLVEWLGGTDWLALLYVNPLADLLIGFLFVYVLVLLWAAVPAAVVERRGVLDALRRSWDLTAGARWRLVLLKLVLDTLENAAASVVSSATVASPQWLRLGALDTVVTLGLSFQGIVACFVYRELRLAREGTPPEELAEVFD